MYLSKSMSWIDKKFLAGSPMQVFEHQPQNQPNFDNEAIQRVQLGLYDKKVLLVLGLLYQFNNLTFNQIRDAINISENALLQLIDVMLGKDPEISKNGVIPLINRFFLTTTQNFPESIYEDGEWIYTLDFAGKAILTNYRLTDAGIFNWYGRSVYRSANLIIRDLISAQLLLKMGYEPKDTLNSQLDQVITVGAVHNELSFVTKLPGEVPVIGQVYLSGTYSSEIKSEQRDFLKFALTDERVYNKIFPESEKPPILMVVGETAGQVQTIAQRLALLSSDKNTNEKKYGEQFPLDTTVFISMADIMGNSKKVPIASYILDENNRAVMAQSNVMDFEQKVGENIG